MVQVIVLSKLLKQLGYWHDGENAVNVHTDKHTDRHLCLRISSRYKNRYLNWKYLNICMWEETFAIYQAH